MSRSTLTHPSETARPDVAGLDVDSSGVDGPGSDGLAGCVRLAVELSDPATALDALCKLATMLRGRRWDVRAVDADLDAGTVHVLVRTTRAELLANQVGRVVAVRAVRVL